MSMANTYESHSQHLKKSSQANFTVSDTIYHINTNQKKVGVAILMIDPEDFRTRFISRDKQTISPRRHNNL